ncbi:MULTISPECIES: hypothetical protein [unclassified Chryseobacterium]|uniref:hypothetical protein n=1 Tax=unclassified Chryseobacterium TaxID=2593645 RepID=UPI00100A3DA5|nr:MULTISPECIES: hypothetical protein [unclassified Chryseobacterium]RXM52789.1 hypothetical protein BOQ64_08095 [Chryseobacterium sp. CH25]RXM66846.1 hypothetical protein BOQ60_02585 [Chryseobacterium sp. CH1]
MKKIILFTGIGLATILGIQACGSSDDSITENRTTTVAQDKENIKKTINSFYDKLNVLDDGDLSKYILYTMFNNTAQEYDDSYLNNVIESFETQFGEVLINNKLQFATKLGVYTYNNTTGQWAKTGNSTGIVLKFPSVKNQAAVDGELALTSYSDIQTSYNSETIWLPKTFDLTLKRNDNTIFSMNLSNVTFDNSTNFSMPISANIKIFASPWTQTIVWQRNSSKEFQFKYNAATPQGANSEVIANVTLKHTDYANISSKDDFKAVSVSVTEGNLKITGSMNLEALAAINDPTDSQINANSKAQVYYSGQKVGEIIYKTVNGQGEFFIVYADGTTENTDVYIGDFEQKIKAIFANYIK